MIGGITFNIMIDSSWDARSTLLSNNTRVSEKFYYFELDHNLAIPVGTEGKCNEKFYRIVRFQEGNSILCVVPREILGKYSKELDILNQKALIYSILKELDPSSYSCVFLVRPSAFDFYHRIIKNVVNLGFEVMWFPLENLQPLMFNLSSKQLEIKRQL